MIEVDEAAARAIREHSLDCRTGLSRVHQHLHAFAVRDFTVRWQANALSVS